MSDTPAQTIDLSVDILGMQFDNLSAEALLDVIRANLHEHKPLWIVTGNVHYVMRARKNPQFAALIATADLVVADGVPILWAAQALGTPLSGRVNGTDLVWRCAELSANSGARVALIGGSFAISQQAAAKLIEHAPGAIVKAFETPFPLTVESSAQLADQVRQFGADILLAGLPTGAQETWLTTHGPQTGALVRIGVGGSFDLISGQIPRAPQWMQRAGLEWLWRLSREPRRLWRRYLVEDAGFVGLVVRNAIGRQR